MMIALVTMLILGTLAGLVIAALGHPVFYRMVFGGRKKRSLDFKK